MKIKIPKIPAVSAPTAGKALAVGGVAGAILGAGHLAKPDTVQMDRSLEVNVKYPEFENKLNGMMDTMRTQFEVTDKFMSDMAGGFNRRMSALEENDGRILDSMNTNFRVTDDIISRIKGNISGRVDGLAGKVSTYSEQNDRVIKQMNKNTEELRKLEKKLEKEVEELKDEHAKDLENTAQLINENKEKLEKTLRELEEKVGEMQKILEVPAEIPEVEGTILIAQGAPLQQLKDFMGQVSDLIKTMLENQSIHDQNITTLKAKLDAMWQEILRVNAMQADQGEEIEAVDENYQSLAKLYKDATDVLNECLGKVHKTEDKTIEIEHKLKQLEGKVL